MSEQLVYTAIRSSPWTDARVEQLKVLLADGFSASRIASAIGAGVTRNAVISKTHRLGLASTVTLKAPSQVKPRARRPQRKSSVSVTRVRQLKGWREAVPQIDVDLNYSFLCLTIDQLDHAFQLCRYPRGEGITTTFCGQPVVKGRSYCPHCCKIVTQVAA